MRPRLVVVAILAVLLAGCAIPRWVPWIGKSAKRDEPKPSRVAARIPERSPTAVPAEPDAKPRLAPPEDNIVDRVVAVVNNDAITLGELQESIAFFRQENPQRTSATDDELATQFLTRLIDNRLQLQEAEREKIVVEAGELEDELKDRVKKLADGDEQRFEAMAREQGLTMGSIKKRLVDSIRVQKVIRRKVALRVSVTDQEIDRYLEENREKLETGLAYHARHILIRPEGDASDAAWEAARIRADLIHDQLLAGADFAELARQYSGDASARGGGDLGTLKRGELAQDIETQILRLQPGQVSRPYKSSLGFHLFRLESEESLEGEGLKRVRQQIQDILFRQKYQVRLEQWLKEIKERAIIEIRM